MILIASNHSDKAQHWHEVLKPHFSLYDLDVKDYRGLELCLKKVTLEALVLDFDLLGDSGVQEISSLRELQPHLNIIIVTDHFDQREEISAILFGAKAFIASDIKPELLIKVVTVVLAGELWVDRKFISRLLLEIEDITKLRQVEAKNLDEGIARMTPRENEIAGLVATGSSNRKIAEQLNISERTVKAHLGVIFRKIGISDRLQLALYMNRHQQLAQIWHGSKGDHRDQHSKH